MNFPETLRYSKSHEWVKNEEGMVVIGLTDFAQSELGDLVFVNLPEVDDTVTAGEALGDVESVKAVSDIFSRYPELSARSMKSFWITRN